MESWDYNELQCFTMDYMLLLPICFYLLSIAFMLCVWLSMAWSHSLKFDFLHSSRLEHESAESFMDWLGATKHPDPPMLFGTLWGYEEETDVLWKTSTFAAENCNFPFRAKWRSCDAVLQMQGVPIGWSLNKYPTATVMPKNSQHRPEFSCTSDVTPLHTVSYCILQKHTQTHITRTKNSEYRYTYRH